MNEHEALQFQVVAGVTDTVGTEPVGLQGFPSSTPQPSIPTAAPADIVQAHIVQAKAVQTTHTEPAHAPQHSTGLNESKAIPYRAQAADLSTGADALSLAKAQAAEAQNVAELKAAIEAFKELAICKTATNTVFCDGNPKADIMLLGEAPGANEDLQGIPFCGESGKILDKFLFHAGFTRAENAYISNVVFWRPPGNRKPTPEEIEICRPFFMRHIALFRPKHIICVGATPINALLQNNTGITKLREAVHQIEVEGHIIPVHALFHPSYLLRQPQKKRFFWQDLLRLKLAIQGKSQ